MASIEEIFNSKEVIETLGLECTEEQRAYFLAGIRKVMLNPLPRLYPSGDRWYAESIGTAEEWKKYWDSEPLKDGRVNNGKRHPIHVLDREQLQHIIPSNESTIIEDAGTGRPCMVILRNFILISDFLKAMDKLCGKNVREKRDARRDDAGKMTHVGYTAGSSNAKSLQMAQTEHKSKKPGEEDAFNRELQGMCSILWNMCRSRLPSEIIDDFNNTISKFGIPRMDMGDKDNNVYSLVVNGKLLFSFNKGELAPPSGLGALNCAKHTHNESNLNHWIMALTTSLEVFTPDGRNFYNAKYGVLVEAAANTLCAWKVRDHHGTTLYKREVRYNAGISLSIPTSLKAALRRDNGKTQAENKADPAEGAIEEITGPKRKERAAGKRKRPQTDDTNGIVQEVAGSDEKVNAGRKRKRLEQPVEVENGSEARLGEDEAEALRAEYEAAKEEGIDLALNFKRNQQKK